MLGKAICIPLIDISWQVLSIQYLKSTSTEGVVVDKDDMYNLSSGSIEIQGF